VKINGGVPPSEYPYKSSCAAGPVELEAVPASGYSFANWSGDHSGSDNPTTVMVNSAMTVVANFIQIPHNLTVDVAPDGSGDVSVDGDIPEDYPASYEFPSGTEVTLAAIAATGYEFSNWSGDRSGSDNPTTITMDSDKSVTAHFTQTYNLTVDVAPDGSGDVSVDGDTPEDYPASHQFPSGTEVTLAAIAATGYEFSNWSGDRSGSDNPTSITMDSDKSVTAHFTQIPQITCNLTVDVAPDGSGDVSVDGDTPEDYPASYQFPSGTEVTLAAIAATGYEFSNWSGDLSGSDNPTTITMDSDKNVTAHFTQITYNLTVDVALDGSGDVSVDGDIPENYPASYQFPSGTEVTLAAIAAPGYEFSHWRRNLSGSDNPTTITMDSDKQVMAHFTQIPQVTYTLTVDAGSGGGIEINGTTPSSYPATYTFAEGTSVNLEAVPASGYSFANWSGDLSGSDNPTTITMDSDKEVVAHFTQIPQITYTLTVDVSPNSGMVTLEPSQPAGGYVAGTEVTLTAVASEGYKFDHWGGSIVSSEDTITITMDSDKEITASFTEVASSTFPWAWVVAGVAVVGLLVYSRVSGRLRI